MLNKRVDKCEVTAHEVHEQKTFSVRGNDHSRIIEATGPYGFRISGNFVTSGKRAQPTGETQWKHRKTYPCAGFVGVHDRRENGRRRTGVVQSLHASILWKYFMGMRIRGSHPGRRR